MIPQELCGWISNPAAVEAVASQLQNPTLLQAAPNILGTGAGKDAFLFEIERVLTGKVRDPHNQTIGDCVSHGVSGGTEDLQFVQMSKDGTIRFYPVASEAVYGLARIQIGQGQCGRGDGAVVAWGLKAVMDYGIISREKHGNYDLSVYDGNRAKAWGAPRAGLPKELEAVAKEHPIKEATQLTGPNFYEQARDVIVNGGLIVTGSNQLYSSTRDATGFCKPQGSGGHCTYYRGVTDNQKRPGIAYQQSWGKGVPSQGEQKVTLPHGREVVLPCGCFFIDAEYFDRMHSARAGGEVWAITSEEGWERPDSEIQFVFYN